VLRRYHGKGVISVLTITRAAAEAIKRIVSSSSVPEGGLKISTTPEDEKSATLSLSVAGAPDEADRVVEERGSRVFVDQSAASYVEGKVLDAQIESGQLRFSLEEHGA